MHTISKNRSQQVPGELVKKGYAILHDGQYLTGIRLVPCDENGIMEESDAREFYNEVRPYRTVELVEIEVYADKDGSETFYSIQED